MTKRLALVLVLLFAPATLIAQEDEVRKSLIMQDLRKEISLAKREHGINVSPDSAEVVCSNKTSSLADCQGAASSVQAQITEQVR